MAPRRLWHVLRAVLFMLRKGMSKRPKLAMDFQLLLLRGKTLGRLMASSSSTAAAAEPSSFSWRTVVDPAAAPGVREVEFSCSNTPSLQITPAKRARRRRSNRRTHRGANGGEPGWYNYDAADIAEVFEVLNNELLLNDDIINGGNGPAQPLALAATPSTAALWSSFGRSPAAPVRQLRVTDSPFPVMDEEPEDGGGMVDQEADEFIRRFYNQLRTEESPAATPEYGPPGTPTGVAY